MSGASLFQDSFAVASEGIDEVFGECWSYQPMAKASPNGRPAPDSSRAVVDSFVAVYLGPYARASSGIIRRQGLGPERPGHASDRPVCDVTLCRLPYPPRACDRVTRLQTGDLYEIVEPRPNGVGRSALDLNLLTPGS
jgi:hypothetical protein